ncbi:MAG: type II secretion system protein [Pirellulaceae bacterium]|nr:type II secretion system protein [Pirellulaceae bacterium]
MSRLVQNRLRTLDAWLRRQTVPELSTLGLGTWGRYVCWDGRRKKLDSPYRTGFSLLEVIIATAVLAGSAMILVSVVGAGARFGTRAERQTLAYAAAQSVLDEFLAVFPQDSRQTDWTGPLDGPIPMSYRIITTDFNQVTSESSSALSPGGGPSAVSPKGPVSPGGPNENRVSTLQRVIVEVFDGDVTGSSEAREPLCRLSRLARRPIEALDSGSATEAAQVAPPARAMRDAGGGGRL